MATSDATIRDFLLPDLGEGLTEGEIANWLVDVGTIVDVDDPVAEVETAKAVVEIPSPFAGVVVTRHAEVGEEIEVGQPLISIDTDPEAGTGADTGTDTADEGAATAPDAAAPARADDVEPSRQPRSGDPSVDPGAAQDAAGASDLVPAADADGEGGGAGDGEGRSGNVLVGYGTGGGGGRRRRRGGTGRPAPAGDGGQTGNGHRPARGQHGRPLAKPPVRKLAKDLGVDLRQVEASGPGGTVTRDDVHAAAAADERGGAPAGAARPTPGEPLERIPLKGVRRLIAEKMTVSRREIPEATTWVDADATALMAMRAELNDAQSDVRVSPLALVMRACVAGLRRFPQLNASLDEAGEQILVHRAVHLGFAAQTDRGLVVPVIADAHERSTLDIAAELTHLADAAREGRLAPEQLTGSTFTVSNYGSFGVDGGAPVINHPEAALLGVGRIVDRPWVHHGQVAVRQVVQLSIAFDHRICDGGEAAGFLRFVADCVERPALLLASL